MFPGPGATGRGTPARRRVLPYAAAAVGVYLARAEARSFRDSYAATTDDPRIAVLATCSNALYSTYRALLLLGVAVTGVRRYRTHRKGETHV